MRKELFKEVEIPEGVDVEINGNSVKVKGPEGEISRKFYLGGLKIEEKNSKIVIGNKKSTKREKKQMNTIASHIANMIQGVQKKYEYKLKICYSHFPFTVEIKGSTALIKNFLGEKNPRKMVLPQGAEIDTGKEIITITSVDKEKAGQVAANFERLTKIKGKDRRVFQDGIFMIEKGGKEI